MILPAAAVIAKGLGAVCLILGIALGAQTVRLAGKQTELATEQRDRATDRATAALAAVRGTHEALEEYRMRVTDQQEVIDDQAKILARARADAAAAAGSADRLRNRAAELAAGCGAGAADTATAGAGASAAAPGRLLADMLGRIDDTARVIAAYADDASIAGATCERAYDALRRRE